jgi:VWFA-related protein
VSQPARPLGPVLTSLAGACFALGVASATGPVVSGQTFRASVDLIAVDVQVVDRDGRPMTTLMPEDFEVTLDGRRRRVVSATFTEYRIRPVEESLSTATIPQIDLQVAAADQSIGRTFIIAVDSASFRTLDVRVATLAAERFTRQLNPEDKVGVIVLPDGPKLSPTTSHAAARRMLGTVVGRRITGGQFEMSVEEVIDITAAMANQSQLVSRQTVRAIVAGEDDVGSADSIACSGPVTACTEQAMSEAASMAVALEQDVLQGIAGLDGLLRELQDSPGRKNVLLLSGGMPVSDRSGGRPTLDNEVKRLGEQATYANATINTIFFDPTINQAFSSGSRRRGGLTGREAGIYTRALSEFSEPSGGILLVATTGIAESEVDRIVRDGAAYYVLGVAPEDRDRDGRPHRLQVRVAKRGLSIRNRQLVVVPKQAN